MQSDDEGIDRSALLEGFDRLAEESRPAAAAADTGPPSASASASAPAPAPPVSMPRDPAGAVAPPAPGAPGSVRAAARPKPTRRITTRILEATRTFPWKRTWSDLATSLPELLPALTFFVGLLWLVAAWVTGRALFLPVALLFLVPPIVDALQRGRGEKP
ncbi:MAG: hypothetical protein HYZ53_28690 [Planctomycetes bacterium]|nr:hypothetical protein [Planctomycetota bacterium]